MQLHDPIGVTSHLVVDVSADPVVPPIVWWDGTASLRNARLRAGVECTGVSGEIACHGKHNGHTLEGVSGNIDIRQATLLNQPVTELHGRIGVSPGEPDILRVESIIGKWFGGTLGGEARIEFKDVLRYRVKLAAAQVQLEEFARHNAAAKADMQGAATAQLYLEGEGRNIDGLKGVGLVEVPDGKLYRLPLLLDLIKAFTGLRVPDRTAFEQASAAFKIDGPQLEIQHVDLIGTALSLRGAGTLNIDGTDLNLDFYAAPARMMRFLPPALNELPRVISDQLFKIKVRGQVSEPRFENVVAPAVTEPLRRILSRE
jgi:hypothetical protein